MSGFLHAVAAEAPHYRILEVPCLHHTDLCLEPSSLGTTALSISLWRIGVFPLQSHLHLRVSHSLAPFSLLHFSCKRELGPSDAR